MATRNESGGTTVELSRAEQWVLHHVLLDRIELELQAPGGADPPSPAVYRAFEKLDAGVRRFSRRERRCIRAELRRYVEARHAPERDRPIAERLLERLDPRDARPGSDVRGGPDRARS